MNQPKTPNRATGKVYCEHCNLSSDIYRIGTGLISEGFAFVNEISGLNGYKFRGLCHSCRWRIGFLIHLVDEVLSTDVRPPYDLSANLYQPSAMLTRHNDEGQSTKILADIEFRDATVYLRISGEVYEYPMNDPTVFPEKLIHHIKQLCDWESFSWASFSRLQDAES